MQLPVAHFPNAVEGTYSETSPIDPAYNCIAWSVNDTKRRWWPGKKYFFWPNSLPKQNTVESFVAMYSARGFEECSDGTLEKGFIKVALFEKDGVPTHAARQDAHGWTSKLGSSNDIHHDDLACIAGGIYGNVVKYFRKRIPKRSGSSK